MASEQRLASVQRLMMYFTPVFLLDIMARICPKTVIGLLCHWVSEKNPNLLERRLARRRPNVLPVAKKFSQLSTLSILNILRQDESLWKFHAANTTGGAIINLGILPYIFLEVTYELGGAEGREKVLEVVRESRLTIGSPKQGDILEYFKVDTVLDIFEELERTGGTMEIKMRLQFSNEYAAAMWLEHWDLRMQRLEQPMKSAFWLGQIPGERSFRLGELLKKLEFRRKYDKIGDIYEHNHKNP